MPGLLGPDTIYPLYFSLRGPVYEHNVMLLFKKNKNQTNYRMFKAHYCLNSMSMLSFFRK